VVEIKTEHADVLIIGSGGAGLRCAIELFDNKVDVLVVGKCKQRGKILFFPEKSA